MSSMDQGFVKAYSRRRLSQPQEGSEKVSQSEPDSGVAAAQPAGKLISRHSKLSVGQSGSLEINRSIADTAQLWVDAEQEQYARADSASFEIPQPHLDRSIIVRKTYELPFQSKSETMPMGAESQVELCDSFDARLDSLQHIHTAYAGVFNEAPLPSADLTGEDDVTVNDDLAFAADTLDSPSRQHEVVTDLASTGKEPSPSVPPLTGLTPPTDDVDDVCDVIESDDQLAADHFVEMRIDSPAIKPRIESEPAQRPFQPVWEVDVFDVPNSVADLFFEGTLFQQIAERMSEAVNSGLKTVLVTSTKPGEGRSSVAIGVAMAAAAAGISVALVDTDTESPTLADELRLDLQYGWVDVIRRGLPVKEIAVQAVEDGVTLIPLMPPGTRPIATSFEIVQLLDLIDDHFELMILDGPTGLCESLGLCASRVDSALIVRDLTRTSEKEVGEFSKRLLTAGVRGVGVVENFV